MEKNLNVFGLVSVSFAKERTTTNQRDVVILTNQEWNPSKCYLTDTTFPALFKKGIPAEFL